MPKWFDQYGFDYFTRDTYDNWYPGYGASLADVLRRVAATYEQASSRGLIVRKSDGTLMPYRDTVRHHFVSSISTLESAADNKAKFIGGLYQYRVDGIEAGAKDAVREYLMPPGHDLRRRPSWRRCCHCTGLRCGRRRRRFEAGGKQYPAGSYAISMSQPQRMLIHTLLDPQDTV